MIGRPRSVDISAGDTVVHGKWGEGVNVTMNARGTDAEVTVRFEDAGEQHLLLAYAQLRKTG